jgi:threonine synthase
LPTDALLEALGQLCFSFVHSSQNDACITADPLDAQPAGSSDLMVGCQPSTEIKREPKMKDQTASSSPASSSSETTEPPSQPPPAQPVFPPRLSLINGLCQPNASPAPITGPTEVSPLALLDASGPLGAGIQPELDSQRAVASNRNLPLEHRLEAYEDIIDSEVGDTTLSRARNIEREVGLRQIYLKFEGGNPSGTHKDRIAFAQAMDAVRRGFDAITAATCGNYGVALSLAASAAGLKCIAFVPESYHSRRTQELAKCSASIVRVPGDYEAAVRASREMAQKNEVYDANPGGANTQIQLRAYGSIADEIYDELRDAPAVVAVPVSNGTTLAGIYRGFLSLYRRGKISRMPRMVAGSSYNKNPIIQAFMKSSSHCDDLKPEKIKETVVNEPLINWHAIDGDLALEGIRSTGGWASYASDRSLLSYARFILEREALNVLPASTAGLAVLLERHKKEALSGDRYVVVLTGKRS